MRFIVYLLLFFTLSSFNINSNDPKEDTKFCLVFNMGEDISNLSRKSILKLIFDDEISSRFTYDFSTKFVDDTLASNKITEIYYKDILLGKIYGYPSKNFLLKILPILENQIMFLE